jgi:hypothetical protein
MQNENYPPAKVSFEDFKNLMTEVEPYRNERLLSLDSFLAMRKEENVILLDTRSQNRYERKHIKGAVHLAFTDFTQDKLEEVIPFFYAKILIYCNNNFEDDYVDFPTKMMRSFSEKSDVAAQSKPIMLALNIPTYINLYGYGYRNIYELAELVHVDDPRIQFEGSTV